MESDIAGKEGWGAVEMYDGQFTESAVGPSLPDPGKFTFCLVTTLTSVIYQNILDISLFLIIKDFFLYLECMHMIK